ncbi:MAG: carbohydrate ABC transporter permease [Chloroflexi bacterium]|nr:carbohydrate ABC transporter permease [Chloroflexota bacterium]
MDTTRLYDPHGTKLAAYRRAIIRRVLVTTLALAILSLYIMPLVYALVTSLKTPEQVSEPRAPIVPSERVTYDYQGDTYDVYNVPTEDGMQEWALVDPGRRCSGFIDINNPHAGLIEWEGNWRGLEPVRELSFYWSNYPDAWNRIDFPRLLGNTLQYAFITMIGTLVSSSLAAYGFARFNFPFKNVLFFIMISTILLPPAVTLVPTYAFFVKSLGWGGTWWPVIVPHLFGNAYNIFLLRQYFLTIPRELEEAAYIDGANPLQTFVRVILPQSVPVLTAVALFHFFFAWNDFFAPLIYLAGNRAENPISVGLSEFRSFYQINVPLILTAAIISMLVPLMIFFLAQRYFIQGIVVTGVDK